MNGNFDRTQDDPQATFPEPRRGLMDIHATDELLRRLDSLGRSRPALHDAYKRRLLSLRTLQYDGESKRLKGFKTMFESRLSDDLRLLWSRDKWRGKDAIFLFTIGGHDHVFDEAQRMRPGEWNELDIDVDEQTFSWADVPVTPHPERQRYWLIDDQGEPWALDLTDEQQLLVEQAGPLLVTGTAGSGKTTMLAHRAVEEAAVIDGRVLFVTFHEELADFTAATIGRLHGGLWSERIDVWSFKDLCQRLWREAFGQGVPWVTDSFYRERLNDALKAERLIAVPRMYIEAELRGALKGRWLAGQEPPTEEEYLRGQRTDLSFLSETDRKLLYRSFKRLCGAMAGAEKVDALDAARILADEDQTAGKLVSRWDRLFIDEAQDFTRVELELLAMLVPDPSGWAIAADEMQVVYPSLFRWDRVRDVITGARARRDEPPIRVDLHVIETNHRNPEPILNLGHAVLSWRNTLCGSDLARRPEARAPGTLVPRVIAHVSGVMPVQEIAAIAMRVPLTAVLCPSQELADKVRAAVKVRAPLFTRALDFSSAKGLEFDVVIAWHPFAGPDADAFERAARGVTRIPMGVVELSINRLYVAITRSKKAFFSIDEGVVHPTWSLDRVGNSVLVEDSAADLVRITSAEFAEATSDQWADAARSWGRVNAWEQEAESWILAGDHGRAARLLEDHDSIEGAAAEWDLAACPMDAARCRALLAEVRKSWAEAANLWETAGDEARRRVAAAQAAVTAARTTAEYAAAGLLLEGAGRIDAAVDAYDKGEAWADMVRLAGDSRPDWLARVLERQERYPEAARAWLAANQALKALDAAMLGQDREVLETALNLVLTPTEPKAKKPGAAVMDPTPVGLEKGAREALQLKLEREREWDISVRKILEPRLKRLPAYARLIIANRLNDQVMRAEALHDDGRRMEAMGSIADLMRDGNPHGLREAYRLQWKWAKAGDKSIKCIDIARQALRDEVRLAIDGHHANDEARRRVEQWAKDEGLKPSPSTEIIALAKQYREACQKPGQDRKALLTAARSMPTNPVAAGIVHALEGDVARARVLWKEEGLRALVKLNPMRPDAHYPVVRKEYERGLKLDDAARARLKDNLPLLIEACKGKQAVAARAMLDELNGEPGRAWSQLKDFEPRLAVVRHETSLERRRVIERALSRGCEMGVVDVERMVLIARAYAASDSQDALSAAALAVWEAKDLDGSLKAILPLTRAEISLPLTLELVGRVARDLGIRPSLAARAPEPRLADLDVSGSPDARPVRTIRRPTGRVADLEVSRSPDMDSSLPRSWLQIGRETRDRSPTGGPFRVLLGHILDGVRAPADAVNAFYGSAGPDGEDPLTVELMDVVVPLLAAADRVGPRTRDRWVQVLRLYAAVATSPPLRYFIQANLDVAMAAGPTETVVIQRRWRGPFWAF